LKPPRKKTPPEIEVDVFDNSRRRCALCFWLHGDLSEKRGQIAHLDDNPSNYSPENLVFLCLDHHTQYDSRTSQHKNYTIDEVKTARDRLYAAIREGRHVSIAGTPLPGNNKLEELRVAALQRLHESLVRGHNELNRLARAKLQTEEEYRTKVEAYEFAFLDAFTLADIYLDAETRALMSEVLGSFRQMCTSIWFRLPAVFEAHGKYADSEIREPDWRLFVSSFQAAKNRLHKLLNPSSSHRQSAVVPGESEKE
jgi:hypothetical protein